MPSEPRFLLDQIALAQAQLAKPERRERPVAWAERIAGYKLDPWQRDLIDAPAEEEIVAVCSRQVGKSSTTALKAAALVRDGGLAVAVAPTQRQSSIIHRQVRHALQRDGLAFVRESATEIETVLGGRAICLPGDRPSTIRGETLVHDGPAMLILDEAAYVKPSIWSAISPMRAAAPMAGFVMLTTPCGPVGEVYRSWTQSPPEVRRIRVKATDCPRISARFLEGERRRLGDLFFRQEYLAEFVASTTGVFGPEALAAMFGEAPTPEFGVTDEVRAADSLIDVAAARAKAEAWRTQTWPRL